MKRLIFLVDMNSFFISCEMARTPRLKGIPAAVAGDPKNRSGIIFSPNYDARAFGVKTTMLVREAQRLCPGIVFVSPDHVFYEKMSKMVMEILSRYSPVVQQNSIDEAWLDLTGCEGLFGKPLNIAEKIMFDIENELDLWCSIGISENKFLSKMASEIKKPRGITQVWSEDVPSMLWPLPIRAMYGIGKQTEKKLHNYSIYTIGELAVTDISFLRKNFGKYGEELHLLSNGIDDSPVEVHPHHDSRSISRSTTLSKDTTDLEYLSTILLQLSDEIGSEARRNALRGRTVYISIKYSDFQSVTRQKSMAPTCITREIYEAGVKLLKENLRGDRPIRLIGIGLSSFDDEDGQISFMDLAGDDIGIKKEEKLDKTMDIIKEKYGIDIIKRAKLVKKSDQLD